MGVSEEQIAAAMRPPPDEDFGIWEENWDTWLIFQALSDRWTYVGTMQQARRIGGPSHAEIESTVRLWGVPRRDWRTVFRDLKEMVWAVLEVDRQQAA